MTKQSHHNAPEKKLSLDKAITLSMSCILLVIILGTGFINYQLYNNKLIFKDNLRKIELGNIETFQIISLQRPIQNLALQVQFVLQNFYVTLANTYENQQEALEQKVHLTRLFNELRESLHNSHLHSKLEQLFHSSQLPFTEKKDDFNLLESHLKTLESMLTPQKLLNHRQVIINDSKPIVREIHILLNHWLGLAGAKYDDLEKRVIENNLQQVKSLFNVSNRFDKLETSFISIMLTIFLISIVSYLLFFKALNNRLKALSEYACNIAKEKFYKPGFQSNDKTGELALHLEEMSEHLQALLLEARNATEYALNSKAKAEKEGAHKGKFLNKITEDIQGPISGVLGVSALFKDTALTAKQKEYLDTIESALQSILSLVDDIINFSNIESGQLDIEKVPFNLERIIEETTELLKVKAQASQLQLWLRFDPRVPLNLIGDPGRLRQVIMNFVYHAISYTQKGHVYLDIKCLDIQNNQAKIQFSIKDTSSGLSQEKLSEMLSYIQNDIVTVDNKTKDLGLIINAQLISLMQGKMRIESHENVGTRYWFTLNFEIESSQSHKSPIDLNEHKVAILDTSEYGVKIIKELCVHWGMVSHCFSQSPDALDSLEKAFYQQNPFTFLILDEDSTNVNCLEICRKISVSNYGDLTKIVLLTSHLEKSKLKMYRECGIWGVLSKPISPTRLKKMLLDINSLESFEDLKEPLSLFSEQEKLDTKDLNILLVEDNPTQQMVALRMLKKIGAQVELAKNGHEAVEKWIKSNYNLIFMDCNMPVMDGYRATSNIRELESSGQTRIPIIALSPRAMMGDREKCITAGMDDFITKPLSESSLRKVVYKFCAPNA